ncbi:hypothetical protein C3L33_05871, partial [Rhododendron williamsianum]
VCVLVDNLDIGNINSVNLRAATSAALLLSPSKFSEEDLYARICSLSYMGDLRMLFAEDKNKVSIGFCDGRQGCFVKCYKVGVIPITCLPCQKLFGCNTGNKIVQGQFALFQSMYKPILEEFAAKNLLRFTSSAGNQANVSQVCTGQISINHEALVTSMSIIHIKGFMKMVLPKDCGLSVVSSLVSRLPPAIRSEMALKLGNKTPLSNSGMIFELWRFDPANIDKIGGFASHEFPNNKHRLVGILLILYFPSYGSGSLLTQNGSRSSHT